MQTTTTYLIHLESPVGNDRHQASHYLGSACDVSARVARHRSGKGARLLAAAVERGIGFAVVRLWDGGRGLERQLKQRGHAAELCPVCSGDAAYRRAAAATLPLAETDDLPAAPAGVRGDWYEVATQQRWRAAASLPASAASIATATPSDVIQERLASLAGRWATYSMA